MQSQSKGDGAKKPIGDWSEMPTSYLMLRREVLAMEIRPIEDELMERRTIKRRLVAKARRRDG